MSKYTYILDNGHGEETELKESPVWNDNTQLLEYEFNRNVVKYLSFMLRQNKIDCITLVPELKDIPIQAERVPRSDEIHSRKQSIIVSIHSNQYMTDQTVNGFETHYISEKGNEIAKIFQKHLGKLGKNRGVKKSSFAILKYPKCVAVLTENGFYSNEKECRKLMSNDFQYDIAYAHYKAIREIETLNI